MREENEFFGGETFFLEKEGLSPEPPFLRKPF